MIYKSINKNVNARCIYLSVRIVLVDIYNNTIARASAFVVDLDLLVISIKPRYRPIFEHHGVGQEGHSS